jgi:hypothetical protein
VWIILLPDPRPVAASCFGQRTPIKGVLGLSMHVLGMLSVRSRVGDRRAVKSGSAWTSDMFRDRGAHGRSGVYWGDWGAPNPVLGGLARADTRVTVTLSEGRQRLIRTCPTEAPDEL